MTQRAWKVPAASLVFGLLVCLALSTQFLFQRTLYQQWSGSAIVAAWLRSFVELVGVAASILAALWVAGRVPARSRAVQLLWFGCALLAGAYAGEWAVLWSEWGDWPTVGPAAILPRAMRWLPIGAVTAVIFISRQRTSDLGRRLHESEVNRTRLEQQQVAVQLQVLQSQIEPHFLFNTLATIRRLQHVDPARGREALAGFIDYLRASLPELRTSETTLGRELALIGAYLDVLQVRMGERLRVEIDVPPGLRRQHVPPLSLATLVENSIKHGIGHLPEGGTISIHAWIEHDRLHVRVADTGVGLTGRAGSGMGLTNLRGRLRSLHGDAGALVLAPNEPRGFAATLQVPVTRDTDG